MEPGLLVTLIFGALLVLLALGVPVAFSLFGVSLFVALVLRGPAFSSVVYLATFGTLTRDIYLAIPLFIFMAAILEFSGVVANLYEAAYKWSGPFRGGLAVGTLFVAAILAAMSGLGATATVSLGLLAVPEMLKRGYDKHLVLGSVPAGGALGPIIPPSIVMIILGGLTGISVGRLFIGGVLPGLLILALGSAYILTVASLRPHMAPALPPESRASWSEKLRSLRYTIAPIALIVLVLGGIYMGIFTPTEAGAIGAGGAFLCALINGRLHWTDTRKAMRQATHSTAMVMWLLCSGAAFATVMQITGLSGFIRDSLLAVTTNPMVLVGLMMLVAIILGCFMDAGANLMICVPIFWPVVQVLAVDPVWWGVAFTVALCVGYITPPFGMNLFYLKGVAPPNVSIGEIYRGSIPFVLIYFISIVILFAAPSVVTWLPRLLMR